MVVVRCLILCSKFAENRLPAGLCPDPLGKTSWVDHGGTEWKGEMEGQKGEGRGWEGKARGGKGKGWVSLRMKFLATALTNTDGQNNQSM